MATTTAQMYYQSDNNTYLNAWVTAFINALVNVTGWLQTSDTGQTVSNGFSFPNTYNADLSYGYQIYTFTDSLTATYPLYVKFEFGGGNNNNGMTPAMWVTVGTGTNGSGTLTGQVSQRLEISDSNGGAGGTLFTSYFSGASNRFVCGLWDTYNINSIISIERSKDANGNDNGDGFILYTGSRRSGSYQQFIPFTGTILVAMPFWMGAFSPYSTMAVNNLVGITFPTPFNAVPYNSGYNLAISNGTDIPQYNTVTGTIYGNSHTYLQLQYNNGITLTPPGAFNYVTGGYQSPYNNSGAYSYPLRPLIRYD